jgi:AP-2 complex subunit alpha
VCLFFCFCFVYFIANLTCFLFNRFVCKANGVLYENEFVQIGVKMETKANLTRLGMFYGNKTSSPFVSFCKTISM